MICAIHQPNFFPWRGYFDKIDRADLFVFLDRADYPKSGSSMSSYTNRVKIRMGGTSGYIRCPVVRESGPQPINSVRIKPGAQWRERILAQIRGSYAGARNYPDVRPLVEEMLSYQTDLIADFNIHAVRTMASYMGLKTEFVRESDLPATNLTSTERLIWITHELGATTYLSGDGAEGYQDDEAFGAAGIELTFQQFEEEPFSPREHFIPGLSALHWLLERNGNAL